MIRVSKEILCLLPASLKRNIIVQTANRFPSCKDVQSGSPAFLLLLIILLQNNPDTEISPHPAKSVFCIMRFRHWSKAYCIYCSGDLSYYLQICKLLRKSFFIHCELTAVNFTAVSRNSRGKKFLMYPKIFMLDTVTECKCISC